jgi:hypothetical protein
MALMGAGDSKDKKSYFNALLSQEKKGLMSSLKDLGIATTLGGTKMTASQEEAIGKAAKLQAGTTQTAIDFFAKDLNLSGMKKTEGGGVGKLEAEVLAHQRAAREVGKDLTLGMEAAGRYATKPGEAAKSKSQQMKALSALLSSTDDNGLSEEQKTLKKGLLDKGFKDVLDKQGNIDEAKLIKLFKKTETTIAEKNALDPSKGQEGKNQVTAVFEKGQKFTLDGTIRMETGLIAGEATPTNTSSA